MKTRLCKWLITPAVLCFLSIVATNVTAKKPPKEPVLIQPAFAYYCKSNPNSGAICLSNADGTETVKVFTTTKFSGDQYRLSVFQSEETGQGAVLVVDRYNLYRIDYTLDEDGVLEEVHPAMQLTSTEMDPIVKSVEWDPNGEKYVFTSFGKIYLSSRANFATGDWGEPLVSIDEDGLLSSPAWGPNNESLYFYLVAEASDGSSTWQLRKADIGAVLNLGEGTVTESRCLFATNVDAQDDCLLSDPDLWRLRAVSVNESGTIMASADATDPETGWLEGYYTYLFDEIDETVELIDVIPYFKGKDWISEDRIIGETDSDEIIEARFIGEGIDIILLIKKNATSPDWVN